MKLTLFLLDESRLYLAKRGQWLSIDPLVVRTPIKAMNNSDTLNYFEYANGDPLSFVDPSGKEFVTDTYSWGNDKNNPKGWHHNHPNDKTAAKEALEQGKYNKIGNESYDKYLSKSFDMNENNPKHDWSYFNNCKHENDTLKVMADALRNYDNVKRKR